jgi:hypothetical protein
MDRTQLSPFLAALLLLFAAPRQARAAEAGAVAAALLSITAGESKELVSTLADDTFEGREAGSRGNRAAGIYIVERLKKMGLRGAGPDGSYYQNSPGASNILAMLPGSDPRLKQQVILIGAHYDHVGYGTPRNSYGPVGYIHNGADDNASGVAGLLEVAQAVMTLPEPPRRSILFAFWDGEEKGLLGSQYWAGNPTVPLAKLTLAINIDMIGRLRSRLDIYGTRTSWGLRRLISQQNDVARAPLHFTWEMKPDSDHHSFYTRDIPVIMVHSGMHDDYHRPSDDVEKINYDGVRQVSQLLFAVLVALADEPTLPGFRRQARQETKYDQQNIERGLAPPPGRLGIKISGQAADQGNVVVSSVAYDSPAAKARLRMGDRFLTFAGQAVNNPADFLVDVWSATSPVGATLQRAGEAEPIEVQIELTGKPIRLGISWRVDEAEPGCVIINRLTPGTAADRAGLKLNDRIHLINGQAFATSDQFRQLASEAPSPIVLQVESGGIVRTVEVPVHD